MNTYTIIFKDSEQISIDDWRVINRTLSVDDNTTIGDIKAWFDKHNKKQVMHVEISENELLKP